MTFMQNPYELGALHPDHHERIVADLEGFAQDAGIQPQYICSPLGDFVTDEEREYLKGFRRQAQAGCMGLVLTGKNESGQLPRLCREAARPALPQGDLLDRHLQRAGREQGAVVEGR